jgi:hypothetical protein
MRATFTITALENGAQLEDVQKAADHRDRGTTKLYDRRGFDRGMIRSVDDTVRDYVASVEFYNPLPPGDKSDRLGKLVRPLSSHLATLRRTVQLGSLLPRGGIEVRLPAQNLIFLLYFFKHNGCNSTLASRSRH